VRGVPLKARKLVTIDVGDGAIKGKNFDGAIVRLRPTMRLEPDKIKAMIAWAREHGAVAVKVLPCPSDTPNALAASERPPRRTLSEVVEQLVSESFGKDDDKRERLRAMVEEVMAEEGL